MCSNIGRGLLLYSSIASADICLNGRDLGLSASLMFDTKLLGLASPFSIPFQIINISHGTIGLKPHAWSNTPAQHNFTITSEADMADRSPFLPHIADLQICRSLASWVTPSSSSLWPASMRSTLECLSWRMHMPNVAWRPMPSCRHRNLPLRARATPPPSTNGR